MKGITKQIKLLAISFTVMLISVETYTRFAFGLGDPVLYETSPIYGYRPQPNQDVRRLGKRIYYNAQGLRSEPISVNPAPETIRVLCIGDSITYGGVQTDQTETYPYQLQKLLSRHVKRFEVLNASAGGWAIENQEAYLLQEGIYQSQIVVLQLGTHDLFQPKSRGDLIGHSASFPDRKPLLALQEGFFRYFVPRFLPSLQFSEPNLQAAPTRKDLERNLAALGRIANLVKARKAQTIVILIEQPAELEPQDELTKSSKRAIAARTKELNITYQNLQQDFYLAGDKNLFRDGLHPNSEGNRVMAKVVARLIQSKLEKTKVHQ